MGYMGILIFRIRTAAPLLAPLLLIAISLAILFNVAFSGRTQGRSSREGRLNFLEFRRWFFPRQNFHWKIVPGGVFSFE